MIKRSRMLTFKRAHVGMIRRGSTPHPKSSHDEAQEVRHDVQSLRLEIAQLKRQLESATAQFSQMTSPIGSTLRCFPIRTPGKFTPMAWIPYDGHASATWWYVSDDIPPHVRFLVLDPERNVQKDEASKKIYVRFTSEENPNDVRPDSTTTLLIFLGFPLPRTYTKESGSSGTFVQVPK